MTSYLRTGLAITIMTSPKSDLDVILQNVIQQGPQRYPRSTSPLTLTYSTYNLPT